MRLHPLFGLCLACCLLTIVLGTARPAKAYTPESPKVQAMVAKGLKHLDKAQLPEGGADSGGTAALVAICLHKNGRPDTHPQIQKACATAVKEVVALTQDHKSAHTMYGPCLMAILLAEVDPQKYRKQIEAYMAFILKRQMRSGGWGYSNEGEGDTSQSQYCILAFWTLEQVGVRAPQANVEAAMRWLLFSQGKDGGFSYKPPPSNTPMGNAPGGTMNLTAAGAGSVYICADVLGITSTVVDEDLDLPPALKFLPDATVRVKRDPTGRIPAQAVRNSQVAAGRFLERSYRPMQGEFPLYGLYACERYFSFRELAEKTIIPEPPWYNQGVEALAKAQSPEGFWQAESGQDVCTAFAVLFLMRSTKKSIGKAVYQEGLMRGGMGLPGDTSRVRMKNGRIVAAPVAKSFNDMMSILDDPGGDELDTLAAFPDLIEVKQSPEEYAKSASRLRRFASNDSYEVRLIAVRLLSQTGDLDNVPVMIYALSDPDWRVVREARDGLRYLSRNIDGFGLKPDSGVAERKEVERKWREWYLSIRPTAKF